MNSAMVKINSASANTGDLHRAISLSKKLMEAGKWDGQSLIIWDSAETVRKAIAWQQLSGELPETGWSVKGEELRVDGLEILEGKYEVGDRPHVAVKYEDILYIIHPDDHIIVSKKDKHGITYRVLEIAGVAYYMHQLRYEAGRPNLLARVEELAEGLRKIRDGLDDEKQNQSAITLELSPQEYNLLSTALVYITENCSDFAEYRYDYVKLWSKLRNAQYFQKEIKETSHAHSL